MIRQIRIAWRGLVIATLAMLLSGCYHGGGYFGYGPGAYVAPPYGHHYSHPSKLKPKEKAHLGYGPHAGHPHGAPPGQVKKYYKGHGGHPHGGPPGQVKKHF